MINESVYVKSRGVELYTYLSGNEDSNNVIVVLHGGPGSGAEPLTLLDGFKDLEKDNIVVYFDQRGSGKSIYRIQDGIDKEDIAFDVHTIVNYARDRFKGKEVFLWGGSFGGYLGFLYLSYYPMEVKRYIASSPAIYFTEEGFQKYFPKLLENYEGRVPKDVMKLAKVNDFSTEYISRIFKSKEIREFIFSDKCDSKSMRHMCAMSSWFFNEKFGEKFLNIEIPVLIMQGLNDNWCYYENINEGYKTYKNSLISFKSYDNCGHSLFEDRKDIFAKEVNRFFYKGEV